MKNCISRILMALMVGMYIISTMGYGVHECSHDGTKNMMVLFGETPCEIAHQLSEDGTRANVCSCCQSDLSDSASHNNECCNTEVYVLTHDQVTSSCSEDVNPVFASLYISVENGGSVVDLSNTSAFPGVVYSSGFTKCRSISDLHVALSQFRI